MKLEELYQEVKADLELDKFDISNSSYDNMMLQGKYLQILAEEKMALESIRAYYNLTYKHKYDYYLGRAPAEEYKKKPFGVKVLKSEVNVYLEGDEELVNLKMRVEKAKVKVQFLEGVVKAITSRTWEIKNIIEWKKYMSGN